MAAKTSFLDEVFTTVVVCDGDVNSPRIQLFHKNGYFLGKLPCRKVKNIAAMTTTLEGTQLQ